MPVEDHFETKKDGILFSVVILTFNREQYIKKQLECFSKIKGVEIIIVDNHSEVDYCSEAAAIYSNVKVIRLDKNYGAVGRNYGISAASAPFIVTLDDDVWGLTSADFDKAKEIFDTNSTVDCICFHVLDEKTNKTTNWIHHCHKEKFEYTEFETYEISEGAAIFRKSCFQKVGLYPESFFISHEGPDLAFRILNAGNKIIYTPHIEVIHAHAVEGRASWRRYYYDTRNLIWLAYRNYNKRLFFKRFSLQLLAMFFYSVRDGYIKYFLKACRDAIQGLKHMRPERNPISDSTYNYVKLLDKNRPSLLFYIKERILKKEIKI
ncbi:MAG TPA: glycosyltransferase family 2 protein [Cellvibrio sp.]|nr:glycosyltransferase family 2 protein [Cellvibrio sp.]